MWPFTRKSTVPPETQTPEKDPLVRRGAFSTHAQTSAFYWATVARFEEAISNQQYKMPSVAMDGSDGSAPSFKSAAHELPEALLAWYASQRFIGYQACAMIAQQWLVDKACSMPARDAIRHGFEVMAYGDGELQLSDEQQADIDEAIKRADRKFKLFKNMQEFIRMGRIFGVRVAFFKINGATRDFYENPFNIDGVKPGTYEGIVQVDPYWCVPLLSGDAASDPASMHFYEPEWWIINGQRFHRSHLVIFRNGDLPDLLKPMYNYGGMPVPQRIFERVYAAERTANEAPQLAMTKRLTIQKTDMSAIYANPELQIRHMQEMAAYRDNYGTKFIDSADEVTTQDTSLADLDAVIMTQYQIVAAAAGVPATKLLGTTPKGFNATGEYESQSYHEELETIQANDLTELVNRHHALVMRSEVEPDLGIESGTVRVEIDWNPVDSPTAKEYAEINKINAETDNVLLTAGAIDAVDIRNRLRSDSNSGYADLSELDAPATPEGPEDDDILGSLTDETPESPPIVEA